MAKICSKKVKRRNPVAWALSKIKAPLPVRPKKGKGSYNRKKKDVAQE